MSEFLGGLDASNLSPLGLVDIDAVQDLGELVPVFSVVNLLRVRAENVDPIILETERNVLWKLTYAKAMLVISTTAATVRDNYLRR